MANKTKLWATRLDAPGAPILKQDSKKAAYDAIKEAAQTLRRGSMIVHVDERDGYGWRFSEKIDLADLPGNPHHENVRQGPPSEPRRTDETRRKSLRGSMGTGRFEDLCKLTDLQMHAALALEEFTVNGGDISCAAMHLKETRKAVDVLLSRYNITEKP